MGARLRSGFSAMTMMIVEQFGFAMMPLCSFKASGLTSGTTSGTSLSMRNVLELSMTTAPAFTAAGANVLLAPPPAKSAMSIPSKESSRVSATVYSLPMKAIFLPAEREDASKRSSANGNLRSSMRFKNSCPTAPVAPMIATLYFFMLPSPVIFSCRHQSSSFSKPTTRPASSLTFLQASTTPGMNDSRLMESWRIVNV